MTELRGSLAYKEGKGILGFKGEEGDSAYIIAVKNGYQGSEEEWVNHFGLDLSGYLQGTDVVDDLTSTYTARPLSANQGKVLKTTVDTKANTSDIVDNLTTDISTKMLSAKQGKTLKDAMDANDAKVGTLSSLNTTDKTNVVNAINEVNEKVEDTGWIDITLNSGTTTGIYGGKPQYRKIGNHVFIRGGIAFTKTASSHTFAYLPAEICPPENVYRMEATGGTRVARVGVSTAGSFFVDWIYLLNGTSAYSGEVSWLIVDVDYFLDEEE